MEERTKSMDEQQKSPVAKLDLIRRSCNQLKGFNLSLYAAKNIRRDISPAASRGGSEEFHLWAGQWFASMRHASPVVARAARTDLVALVDLTGPAPLAVDALAEAAAAFPAPDCAVSSQVSHVQDILVDVSVLVPTVPRYAFALHVGKPFPVRGPTMVRGLPGVDRTARGESRFRRRSCLTAAISCSAGSTAAASAERKLRRKLA
ncbi:hypothetical protein C4D60_Mb01t24890 [Musa balbisiana]|uniref:Uncharacterized protein n=1 Tax=Musa balbisiana TaxID=52838 RepID=A0A4S8JQG9_MUSBA|nr:hypothetical protein C4D60_Mb01t24890 [Musa balbisiana]